MLLAANPAALEFPCDIYGVGTVRGLLRHIVAVELRYSERLSGEPLLSMEKVPDGSAEELFAQHDQTIARYRKLLADDSIDWDEKLGVYDDLSRNANCDAEENSFTPSCTASATMRNWRRWCASTASSPTGRWIFSSLGLIV